MYKNLVITFNNGQLKTFHENEWFDYFYDGNFIVVKDKNGAWIAMYNSFNISSVELNND